MIRIQKPIPPLDQFIKYIWLYENSLNATKKEAQTFIVQGCPIILFHYKQPLQCRTGSNDWASHPSQCIIGQIKNYGEIIETGNVGMIAVVFYPDGLYPFIKAPIDSLTGLIVDLPDVFGKEIKEINEKICETDTDNMRISLVEQFLLKQLKTGPNHYSKELHYAISQMQLNNKISITNLASEINMSKRNFERRFREYVGLTPVFYNRIVRFQKAIELLSQKSKISSLELAYSAGYYDQSHFIRDFKQFYGQAPKEFNNIRNFG